MLGPKTLNEAWKQQLHDVFHNGSVVRPRGMPTRELLQQTLRFDMNHPVVTIPARALGYKFMAAEAWWILSGRNDVASIAPYSKVISNFSDDGVLFFGSYGVPFVAQLEYVVGALENDEDTRQATMTFWRQNPQKTKDVPCTVAIDFKLRSNLLHTQVFMRSSDNWLGVPYDAFNFTIMACRVLEVLNEGREPGKRYQLGECSLTAASSHIYGRDFDKVRDVMLSPMPPVTRPVPLHLYGVHHPDKRSKGLVPYLDELKDCDADNHGGLRWWV